MPLHLFQSLGHKNGEKANLSGSVEKAQPETGWSSIWLSFSTLSKVASLACIKLLYPTKTSVKLWLNCLDCKLRAWVKVQYFQNPEL